MGTLQMLWINILMDTFAALALATEPPSLALLEERPYSRADSIITPVMWRNILGQVVYQIIIFMNLLFLTPDGHLFGYSFIHDDELYGNLCPKFYELNDDKTTYKSPEFGGKC
jgi:magnesium-transporting ATPase (P-type)